MGILIEQRCLYVFVKYGVIFRTCIDYMEDNIYHSHGMVWPLHGYHFTLKPYQSIFYLRTLASFVISVYRPDLNAGLFGLFAEQAN